MIWVVKILFLAVTLNFSMYNHVQSCCEIQLVLCETQLVLYLEVVEDCFPASSVIVLKA
jgi:hypothetical protein